MSFLIGTLSFLMLAVSLFMILLVLIQRGRGGGLAGAFGGMGGQSAFGTRAGDTFTRITIVLAVIWVLLAGGLGMMMRRDAEAAKTGKDTGPFIEGSAADEKADTKSGDGAALELDGAKSDAGTTDDTPAANDNEKPKATGEVPAEASDADPAEANTSDDIDKPVEKPADTETPASGTTKPDAENSDSATEAAPAKETPAAPAEPAEETPATEPKP